MQRAAIYLRVSSDRQTVDNQRAEVEQLAHARGYETTAYEEVGSAAKRRPVFGQVLTDARTGKVQAVVIWAIDRLHRSMPGAINDILELDRLGVRVLSVREPWLDTSGPVRPLLVAIFGWVAEQERNRLIERTKAGLERAKRAGKRLGRPPRQPASGDAGLTIHGRVQRPSAGALVIANFPAPSLPSRASESRCRRSRGANDDDSF